MMRSALLLTTLAAFTAFTAACGESVPPPAPPPPPPPTSAPVVTAAPAPLAPKMSRADFNRFALRLNAPLFWAADANGDGVPNRDEVKTLLFYPSSGSVDVDRTIAAILAFDASAPMPSNLSADEVARRKLVNDDLDQGAPSLLYTDLRGASAADKALVQHMLVAAKALDDIYATVKGAPPLASRVPADDVASQSLFRRDWGPACAGAKTPKDSACSAIPGGARAISDSYPAAMQADKDFCATLQKRPDAKEAMADHFSVVREKDGKLVNVPYTKAYAGPMSAIAAELRAAAADETEPGEATLKAYLEAAAKSFTTNDWGPADEAWSRMNAQSSRWYLRVAPDEVLADPCNVKAQFHLNLARIDQGSVRWQSKLTPLEQDMEAAVAGLIGAPYVKRRVTFHLPDFIQVVLNAGDDRQPMGAVAGESLPNWGKVETQGRGRTVAMTNIGTDPDGRAVSRRRVESLFDAASAATYSDADEPSLIGTILHEATHNLGPTYTYVFHGKKYVAAFGGPTAAMLEELKAETGAMYFLDWMGKKGVVSPELARQAYAAWLAWCLRHISTGVRSGSDDQSYSQLAAIQVGFLLDEGALVFDPAAPAANGTDRGAFAMKLEKLPAAFEKLLKVVATIKATNDKAGADVLIAKYVDGTVVPQSLIAERELRYPQTSYVYGIDR
ncbi:MAG: hypothetical protein ABSE49_02625 [Polyangiaceae bacterium]